MIEPARSEGGKSEDAAFEEAYRAYLRCVKEYWTKLDVEAIDLKQVPAEMRARIFDTCSRCWGTCVAPCTYVYPGPVPSPTCTYGTLGTLGTIGSAGGCIGTAGTVGTLATRGFRS